MWDYSKPEAYAVGTRITMNTAQEREEENRAFIAAIRNVVRLSYVLVDQCHRDTEKYRIFIKEKILPKPLIPAEHRP